MTNRSDRLYDLLPAIHRLRDHEQGEPLRAVLQVIAEQVNIVEDEIQQLYDNWFIETCQDWVVPYLGDLIGYTPVPEAGEAGDPNTIAGLARNKLLMPRREVANTIRYRRRKGTLALLELLANDVAGWPARAVEFYTLLAWAQHLNHLRLSRGGTVNLRNGAALDLLNGPFDELAHSVDVRRVNSQRTVGRHNIPSIGLFVWRLRSYSVTRTQAYCLEEEGPHCFTFSALGNDTQLMIKPEPEPTPTHIAGEMNLPAPIRLRAFDESIKACIAGKTPEAIFYGEGKSLTIWAPNWPARNAPQPIPCSQIIAADLSNWVYRPRRGQIAVDPVRGRIAFPPGQLPKGGVRVSYHYGFSADLGGGEYSRTLLPAPGALVYRVVEGAPANANEFRTIREALAAWKRDQPDQAVVELTSSQVYVEQFDPLTFTRPGQSLTLRAANRVRPILRLLDYRSDRTDSLTIQLTPGSRLVLDGLLITGRALHVESAHLDEPGEEESEAEEQDEVEDAPIERPLQLNGARLAGPPAQLHIRHCTLVPGWGLNNNCEPKRPAEPSLELFYVNTSVLIEQSILGSIQVQTDEVATDPIPIKLHDSILDATGTSCDGPECEALGAPGSAYAHAVLTVQDSTIFGQVLTHTIDLGENTIFDGLVRVVRSQRGCIRFSYVPPSSRTPRRYHCQPDLVSAAVRAALEAGKIEQNEFDRQLVQEQLRVRPRFNSRRYATPTYGQLAADCAEEIGRGADDESEIGVLHDLYQPQRLANLRARLEEFTPAGSDVEVTFAS
jgi:hypothetical protein